MTSVFEDMHKHIFSIYLVFGTFAIYSYHIYRTLRCISRVFAYSNLN